MSVYRDILRQSGIYSIVILATRAASFLALPVYTRYLSPAEYGALELIDLACSFIATVIGLRLGDALLYYYADAPSQRQRDRVVSTVLLGSIALGAVAIFGGWMAASEISRIIFRSPALAGYFRIALPTFGLSLPLEVGLCYLRALDRSRMYVTISVIRLVIGLALSMTLLVAFGMGVAAILWANLVSTCATALFIVIYCLMSAGVYFHRSLFVNLLGYSAPLGVGGVSLFLIHYGDRYFLQRSASLADVGLYSLAYKIGMLVSYVQMPFNMYWNARMFDIVRQRNGSGVFARTCTYLTLVLTCFALVLALLGQPLIRILAGPAFQDCAQYIPLLLAAYVIRAIGDQFRNVFFLSNRTGSDARVVGISSIVCVMSYAVLIPRWKVWGAITSTLIAFSVTSVLAFVEARRVQKFPFEVLRLLQILGLAGSMVVVFYEFSPASLASQVGLALALIVLYPLVLAVLGFFNQEELSAIRALPARVRARALTTTA